MPYHRASSVASPGDVMLMSHCDPGQGIMTTGCYTEIQVLVANLIGSSLFEDD